MSPLVYEWTLTATSAPEAIWPIISDTDRLNRALGLGLTFQQTVVDGRTMNRGRIHRFGMEITWTELPFAFTAPDGFTQERLYDKGPVARSAVTVRVERTGDGSTLHYRVQLWPRWALARPIIAMEAQLSTVAAFDRALEQLGRLLERQAHGFDPPPGSLDAKAERALHTALKPLEPQVRDWLSDHIQFAPLHHQARIRPLQVADELGLDPERVICAFLKGVESGALVLTWELLCPSCKAPKEGASSLSLEIEAHCTACNIRYDATFPDSVDVVFRPSPRIRTTEVEVACLLSPARTPHVLLQQPCPARKFLRWTMNLEAGGHRIDTSPWFGGASIEVREGFTTDRITLDLTEQGLRPATLRVRPGPVNIVFRNTLSEPVHLTIERVERPAFTLTAGRLLDMPRARALLPRDAIAPGLQMDVRTDVVVGMRQFTAGKDDPTHLRTFTDPAAAMALVQSYQGEPDVGLAIARGPVVHLTEGEITTPTGSAVERVLDLLGAFGGGRVAVDGSFDADALLPGIGDLIPTADPGARLLQMHHLTDRRLAAIENPAAPQLPGMLAGFTLGDELGRGGMGRVLAATGPKGEQVVLKVMLPVLADDPEHSQRFYNEAQLSCRLDHPHIVRVYDYGTAPNGEMYLVMERLDGCELEDRVAQGPIGLQAGLALMQQLLEALQCAHGHGIVHRDIKPANLFLTAGDQLKVIDFGIAIEIGERDPVAERGVIVGSPRYLSPEQVLRKPLDGRSDLYSAALVLFECITGDVPFQGETPKKLALARLYGRPQTLAEQGAVVPAAVQELLDALLIADPDARLSSAAEVLRRMPTSLS